MNGIAKSWLFQMTLLDNIELIRTRFFPSGLCRNVSCVLEPATAQHMESQINVDGEHPNNESGLYCQR